ncbi:zinc finger protein 43-like isoform X2 [Nilaparvata lugens]|uniref:zinc finger protein 43-like isoform X2 n=1 Tax=Nilaparvata lugens TaxID=108931 RepID=UPI00193CC7F3|nr:zinc finger protein 43-like isoform X2 [Nilaparvata lugens]XP_039284896.1 zinc finger protein 43-like isoform X2 [Nilaparvata lugens]
MVYTCSAWNCKNMVKRGSGFSGHRYPKKDPVLRERWLAAARRQESDIGDASILCSAHFTKDAFEEGGLMRKLKLGAVPTLFDPNTGIDKTLKNPCGNKTPTIKIVASIKQDDKLADHKVIDHSSPNSSSKILRQELIKDTTASKTQDPASIKEDNNDSDVEVIGTIDRSRDVEVIEVIDHSSQNTSQSTTKSSNSQKPKVKSSGPKETVLSGKTKSKNTSMNRELDVNRIKQKKNELKEKMAILQKMMADALKHSNELDQQLMEIDEPVQPAESGNETKIAEVSPVKDEEEMEKKKDERMSEEEDVTNSQLVEDQGQQGQDDEVEEEEEVDEPDEGIRSEWLKEGMVILVDEGLENEEDSDYHEPSATDDPFEDDDNDDDDNDEDDDDDDDSDASLSSSSSLSDCEDGTERKKKQTTKTKNDDDLTSSAAANGIAAAIKKNLKNKSKMSHKCKYCELKFYRLKDFVQHVLSHDEERPFQCEECNKRFLVEPELLVHKWAHTRDKKEGEMFRCEPCDRLFSSRQALMAHSRTHEKENEIESSSLECDKCGKSFSTKARLTGHRQRMHPADDRAVYCDVCNRRFGRARDLEQHKLSHSDSKPFICEECGHGAKSEWRLTVHVNRTHREGRINCKQCDMRFYYDRDLQRHALTHAPVATHKCDKCHLSFKYKNSLWRHNQVAHLRILRFQCGICSKAFTTKLTLQDHTRTHTGERPYQCEVCGKSFFSRSQCVSHARRHNPEKYFIFRCQVCGKRYSQKNLLTIHLLREHEGFCGFCHELFDSVDEFTKHMGEMHANVEKIECDMCGKWFDDVELYKNHRETHSIKEKNTKCEVCAKLFQSPAHLKIHMVTHSEKRQHKCKFCDKTFKYHCYKRSHEMTIHAKLRPFKCDMCGALFAVKTNLQRHVSDVHQGVKRFVCELCGREFAQKNTLQTHMRTHTGEKPFHCDYCEARYSERRGLRRHIAAQHSRQLEAVQEQPEGEEEDTKASQFLGVEIVGVVDLGHETSMQ